MANICKSYSMLYQPLQKLMFQFLNLCKERELNIRVFETWRPALRQSELYKAGTTAASAWRSLHQYGLAFDVAFYTPETRWSWQGDWKLVGNLGKQAGLDWGGDFTHKDNVHFQYPMKGLSIDQAYNIQKVSGILAVWAELEQREYEERKANNRSPDGKLPGSV